MRFTMRKAWENCGGESGYRCVSGVCYRACALCVVKSKPKSARNCGFLTDLSVVSKGLNIQEAGKPPCGGDDRVRWTAGKRMGLSARKRIAESRIPRYA